ncbi:MAG: hypothetical protein KAX15_06135 [Candidatus Omnitrophica bacterium]|nr:hypothetical protein [Candidatus Omnitrophota bacterium]
MSRHTIYLSEEEDQFVEVMKKGLGSMSAVIHVSLKTLQEEQLKKYYQQKTETYPELQKAQKKIINRQGKS